MKFSHFCWVHLQFFCILCGAPSLACDHCLCETVGAIAEAGEAVHDECDCCACSPLVTCSKCSGFTISNPLDIKPLLVQETDCGLPGGNLEPVHEKVLHPRGETDEFPVARLRCFVARSHKMRGSPLFS